MQKRLQAIACLAALALSLSACGDAIPEMSEKQTDMMTEYAAGSILEHTPEAKSRLVDTTQDYDPDKMTKYEKRKLGMEIEEPEPVAPAESAETSDEVSNSSGSGSSSSTEKKEKEEPSMSASEVLGLYGLDVTNTGFEVLDSYPNAAEGTDLVFSMDASAGNKLIVAKVTAVNHSGAEMTLDTISRSDLHFKLILDGGPAENALVTLLSDDFSALNQTLAPGEEVAGVLIAQVSEDLAASISSVDISIQATNGSTVLKQGQSQSAPAATPEAEPQAEAAAEDEASEPAGEIGQVQSLRPEGEEPMQEIPTD